jgi:hypothetical protein
MVYDEKGKFFTQVIPKQPIQVIVQTSHDLIHGILYARHDARLKDEFNNVSERFIAVTDVTVYDLQNNEKYRTGFLLLNIEHILWIIPQEELAEK